MDRPNDFVVRSVSKKTAELLSESGYQTFTSKRTGKHKAVILSKDTSSIKIKGNKLFRQFDTHREVSYLVKRSDILTTLEQIAEQQENALGEDVEQFGEGRFFAVKIGDSQAWKHFRGPRTLLEYITDWQPKDVLNPKSKNYGNMNLKGELITQMALIERDDSRAIPYDQRGNTKGTKPHGTRKKANRRHRR